MDAAGLVMVLMLVGFFHGDQLVHSTEEFTTRAYCEAAIVHAAEFNDQDSWFWSEDTKEKVRVSCKAHPEDREA